MAASSLSTTALLACLGFSDKLKAMSAFKRLGEDTCNLVPEPETLIRFVELTLVQLHTGDNTSSYTDAVNWILKNKIYLSTKEFCLAGGVPLLILLSR